MEFNFFGGGEGVGGEAEDEGSKSYSRMVLSVSNTRVAQLLAEKYS